MLIDNRKRPKKREILTNKGFIRNLVFVLFVFSSWTVVYTKLSSKSAANPVLESKSTNEMVVYHFLGSLVLGGGLCLITLTSQEEE